MPLINCEIQGHVTFTKLQLVKEVITQLIVY